MSHFPMLDSVNYAYFHARTMAFIKSTDEKAQKFDLIGWERPFFEVSRVKSPKLELTWTTKEEKLVNANPKVLYAIFYGVDAQ
ncbi:hypothetical protein Gorai_002566 [Gossypium raimondii]|uniref:Uncharacterized protein n=1 Tax=Gossypium raimondii TaxID=29730 RepID=A0A7J8QLC4_GOSRA|nr:hypothetical protein [Gossypium raimondii]